MGAPNLFTVKIEETGECFKCSSEQSVLMGMERLGKKGVPVGCRGGGCGVCKVQVLAGAYQSKKMSRDCVSREEEESGQVLACRIQPSSDLRLAVLGKMSKTLLRV
jgi:ferredoxin